MQVTARRHINWKGHGIWWLVQVEFDKDITLPCGCKASQLIVLQSYQSGDFECMCPPADDE